MDGLEQELGEDVRVPQRAVLLAELAGHSCEARLLARARKRVAVHRTGGVEPEALGDELVEQRLERGNLSRKPRVQQQADGADQREGFGKRERTQRAVVGNDGEVPGLDRTRDHLAVDRRKRGAARAPSKSRIRRFGMKYCVPSASVRARCSVRE